MIIDDDFDILRYCDAILAPHGHEAVLASDPTKALQILKDHAVDLIVVDVVMPQVSGFDFMLTLKRSLPHVNCPILMLTGRSASQDVKKALDLGATDYMVKPFDRDVFLAKISSILGMQAAIPEVKFAQTSTTSKAEVTFPALITSVNEMGFYMRTLSYVDRNLRIRINSTLFSEIGITCPPLRAASCKPIEDDSEYHYEVFVSFIGLDENTMRKIRRWIASRTISMRKVS
jgi:DNA-binding response OmpR family regulator